jgi:hypothetical protein
MEERVVSPHPLLKTNGRDFHGIRLDLDEVKNGKFVWENFWGPAEFQARGKEGSHPQIGFSYLFFLEQLLGSA